MVKIGAIIPAPPDVWVSVPDEHQEMIYFEKIIGFILVEGPDGKQRFVTLLMDECGELHSKRDGVGTVEFSAQQPETIISDELRERWRESREKLQKENKESGASRA